MRLAAGQSMLMQEIRWAARLRGGPLYDFVRRCLHRQADRHRINWLTWD
jgi:hypothetical protein